MSHFKHTKLLYLAVENIFSKAIDLKFKYLILFEFPGMHAHFHKQFDFCDILITILFRKHVQKWGEEACFACAVIACALHLWATDLPKTADGSHVHEVQLCLKNQLKFEHTSAIHILWKNLRILLWKGATGKLNLEVKPVP